MSRKGATEFLGGKVTLTPGDCLDVLRAVADSSVDSCVTDPPYGLAFMGKGWDTSGPDQRAFAVEFWAEVYRVLKPGAWVVAASGTRTYHRLAVAIEDAGFEIRDMVSWLYGSGFPKSHDVSKGINKAAGVEYEAKPASGVGFMGADGPGGYNPTVNQLSQVGESTPEAAAWQGWGTALKPACEPWVLARKPLVGTVAANVLAHGTGALNIDGCRVGMSDADATAINAKHAGMDVESYERPPGVSLELSVDSMPQKAAEAHTAGRWPANVIHDGSDEVVGAFPVLGKSTGGGGLKTSDKNTVNTYGTFADRTLPDTLGFGDSGSAARFFYSAKADADDRIGSKHPTVKPVDLMQWLVRLVTPKGGLVLDPFAGTGTTGEAAFREGMRAVLIEREPEYQADIARRMAHVLSGPDERRRTIIKAKGKVEDAGPLFGALLPHNLEGATL